MIGIIDYGAGNIYSVKKALSKIGAESRLITSPENAKKMAQLILPGVGSFGRAAEILKKKKFDLLINQWLAKGRPILGICLGMQLMMETSDESKNINGISFLSGTNKKIMGKKIPHIGWNRVFWDNNLYIFNGLKNGSYFYFVHSYYVNPKKEKIIIGKTEYKNEFPSIIKKGSFVGMQFHPEKSGNNGLKILKNWIEGEKKW